MKPSIVAKLEALHERHEEVQALLGDAQTIADQERFRALSREYAQLSDVSRCFTDWQQVQEDIETAQMMLDDPEMREMAQDELREAKEKSEQLEQQLQVLLLPKDPDDERNAFLEVRAGTGGDEAALFAGDLFRMYSRYAEARRWRVEIMSASEGEHGGYKEIIAKISGDGVYGRLKFESGGHRVQRVPATESQGRIHTSACTVAVMPELPDAELPDINPADLRIDTSVGCSDFLAFHHIIHESSADFLSKIYDNFCATFAVDFNAVIFKVNIFHIEADTFRNTDTGS